MSLQHVDSGELYSQAVIHDNVAFLSGQVPSPDTDGALEQTREVLKNLDRRLAEIGSDRSRLINVTIWLVEIGDIEAVNIAWREWLGQTAPPARATHGGATLADPSWRIELTAVAAVN